jgi:hypothetical protein
MAMIRLAQRATADRTNFSGLRAPVRFCGARPLAGSPARRGRARGAEAVADGGNATWALAPPQPSAETPPAPRRGRPRPGGGAESSRSVELAVESAPPGLKFALERQVQPAPF